MTAIMRVFAREALALLAVLACVFGAWLWWPSPTPLSSPPPRSSPPAQEAHWPDAATMERDPIRPINHVDLRVPYEIRRLGLHGRVAVSVVVDETGTVTEATLVEAGHPLVNEMVLSAARRTRYRMPAWTKRLDLRKLKMFTGMSY